MTYPTLPADTGTGRSGKDHTSASSSPTVASTLNRSARSSAATAPPATVIE